MSRKKISASIITHHGCVFVVNKGAVVQFTRLTRLPFKMRLTFNRHTY